MKIIPNATFVPSVNLPSGGLAYVCDGHLADRVWAFKNSRVSDGLTFCRDKKNHPLKITEKWSTIIVRWDAKPIKVCPECLKLWNKFGNQINAYMLTKEEETK